MNFKYAAKKNRIIKQLFVFIMVNKRKGQYRHILSQLPLAINSFVPEKLRNDIEYIQQLEEKAIVYGFVYEVSPLELFLFNYDSLNEEGKKQFVGYYEKSWICNRLANNRDAHILIDKYETYKFFEPFFCREAIKINNPGDAEKMFGFIAKHNGAVIKDAFSSMGKDVTLVHNEPHEMNRNWDSIFERIKNGSSYIAEEIIQQSMVMSAFHPNSVNTVRMMTFKTLNEVVFLGSFLRFGRGASIVDNTCSGGIFAEIDIKTGVVVSDGITQTGEKFKFHPDTGKMINGFAIPRWDELLELSKNLANMLNEHKYVGWDLALTDGGWVLVEGNARADFSNQYLNKKGMRDLIRKYFYPELGLKKDY